ncbi:hypothetical protein EIP86_010823 [Pleurotus ostreatoroseus]|nr:hypothetical protein EIP86_010823 [Pleurotus ostreatoroseus]
MSLSLPLARLPRPSTRLLPRASSRSYATPTDLSHAASRPPPPSPKKYIKYVPPEVEVFSGPSTRRTFATASDPDTRLPRPPPSKQPEPETFSAPSRPRAYYARPERDLPPLQRKWPYLLALAFFGTSAWGAFYFYAANQERLSSSVMRQVMSTIRDSPELNAALGDALRPEPVWWLNGDPVVNGAIHLLQGTVDLSFRVKGHKGAGTLYFTSIRKAKGEPFQILRFRVICDDGQVVEIPVKTLTA